MRGSWRLVPSWWRRGVRGAAVVVATLWSPEAWAQSGFGVRGGIYFPVGALIEQGSTRSTVLQKQQLGAAFLGLQGNVWASRRLAVEGDVLFSPSMVAVRDSSSVTDRLAPVVLTSLRTVLSVGPKRTVFAGTGVGMVWRHGAVWEGTRGTTLPAMILVAGWQAASTKGTPVARVQIEDFVTRVTFDQAFPGRQRFHHDLLWSVGLMIPIRGR